MPRMDGLAATQEIKKKRPETKILIFTVHKAPEYQEVALKAGAEGFLSKDSSRAELIQSINDVLEGKKGLHQNIIAQG